MGSNRTAWAFTPVDEGSPSKALAASPKVWKSPQVILGKLSDAQAGHVAHSDSASAGSAGVLS